MTPFVLSEEDWEVLRADIEAQSEPPDADWLTEVDATAGPYVIGPCRVELPPERIAELADLLLKNWPEPRSED